MNMTYLNIADLVPLPIVNLRYQDRWAEKVAALVPLLMSTHGLLHPEWPHNRHTAAVLEVLWEEEVGI